MASFTKLGEGKYKIYVELGYNDRGKRIRKTKTVTAKSDRALKKAMTDFEIEVRNNGVDKVDNITFSAFVERYFELYANKDLAVKTRQIYRGCTKTMVEKLGDLKMSKMKPYHIVEYFNYEKANGRKSLRNKYICLKSIFSKAIKWEVIQHNPMNGVDKPVEDHKSRKDKVFAYDQKQLKQLLKLLKNAKPRLEMQAKFAALTGLRRAEVNGLRLDSINFKEGTVLVDRQLVWDEENKMYLLGPTENKEPRELYLPDSFLKELRTYVKERKKYQLVCGSTWKGSEFEGKQVDLLFTTLKGGPFRNEFLTGEWSKFIAKQDMPYIDFHGLRHTFASIQLNDGENLKVVSELMGHTNVQETAKTYAHITNETKKNATLVFESMY